MDVATPVPGQPGAVSIVDEAYPPLLRAIPDPPATLHVRGDPAALLWPQIAIVGSRRASPAALQLAAALAGQLVAAGLSVCSGLALGIDGAAHRGALAAGGVSVGVMATGIDMVYPRRHRQLAADLAASGCLVTEFPPGTLPRPERFPKRNRIISGLSLGVLVVEAALPSGSLLTAQNALEQGREVFACPWSGLHEGGRGCLQLLRDGAKMVQGVDDILEELGALGRLHRDLLPVQPAPAPAVAARPRAGLLALLGYETASLDQLAAASGRPVQDVLGELSALEVSGAVVRRPGGYILSR